MVTPVGDHPGMRRLVVSAVAAVLVWPLSACSPADEPIVALAVRDGRPVGILVTCDGYFSRLSVYENDDGMQSSSEDILVTWAVSGRPTTEVVDVELFGSRRPGCRWKMTA